MHHWAFPLLTRRRSSLWCNATFHYWHAAVLLKMDSCRPWCAVMFFFGWFISGFIWVVQLIPEACWSWCNSQIMPEACWSWCNGQIMHQVMHHSNYHNFYCNEFHVLLFQEKIHSAFIFYIFDTRWQRMTVVIIKLAPVPIWHIIRMFRTTGYIENYQDDISLVEHWYKKII